ncbi:MAG: hybrid sensor histidine kinase/response regulator [Novosphingobium sp.]
MMPIHATSFAPSKRARLAALRVRFSQMAGTLFGWGKHAAPSGLRVWLICMIAAVTLGMIATDVVMPGESLLLHVATALGLCGVLVSCLAFVSRREVAGPNLQDLTRERDAAQSASAAKSRYLASVSHEIRSPLNAIYGYAQLVEQDAAVAPKDAARVIRRSAEHLTNLVEGLLDIASVEQGVVRIDNTVVRLGPVVEQVAEMFRPMAEQKGLAFRCDMPGRLPEFVRMDVRRIRQILINLVSNAVKFTQTGEVVLSLRWAGQMATFEVRDTGPGIRQAQAEEAFAPYAQVGEPNDTVAKGAGLGLAITRAIVQMLGGDMQVDSAPGQGSCFRVSIMLPQVSGFIDRAEQARRPTGYVGKRRSIMLVDDNPDHLSLLQAALGELGFDLSPASSGPAALAMAEAGDFDAAILDVSMPGISGWELASHLRAAHGRNLAIMMLSANAEERHGLERKEADHDHFLLKPVDLSLLIDALGRILSLQWTWPESAVGAPDEQARHGVPISAQARDHVDRLKSLVRIGHVRALESEIRSLERADPGSGVLVARLFDCLDRFDLAAMTRTLEEL